MCRLPGGTPWPEPPDDGSLYSATSTGGDPGDSSPPGPDPERSLVCRQDLAPTGSRVERDWRALTVAGPLDFALVGVLAALTMPLAGAGISIFALSTFDTDHLLVKSDDLDGATVALTGDGHTVTG